MEMTWAKATPNDMEAACRLNQILDSMSRGEYPATSIEMEEDSVPRYFDEDQMPHLRALYDRIHDTLESAPGYQGRILGAMCFAILFPGNELLDPDSDIIEKHPKIVQGLADTDRLLWVLSQLPGDVLRALIGVVGESADVTELRQCIDARMASEPGGERPELGEAGDLEREDLPRHQVVAFDGDWHWVRRTDLPDAVSRWVPAQRERGHWNSAGWSGIPMNQIEVGQKLERGGTPVAAPGQNDNVVHLQSAQMSARDREIWKECLRTKMTVDGRKQPDVLALADWVMAKLAARPAHTL